MDVRMAARPPICRSALRALALFAALLRAQRGARAGSSSEGAGVHRHRGDAERVQRRHRDRDPVARRGRAVHRGRERRARRTSTPPSSRTTARSSSCTRRATCSTPAQETALTDYVNGGGGFVGIGETALLEQGGAASFNTLIGLAGRARHGHRRRRATRTSSSWTACTRPRARCRRPGRARRPGTRWATNPTGTVHTVARVRMAPGIAGPGRHDADQRRDQRALRRRARTRSSPRATAPPPGAATSSRAARSTPSSAARARASPRRTSAST